MTVAAFIEGIGLPASTARAALALPLPPAALAGWRARFEAGQPAFEAALRAADDPPLLALALYLRWGAALWPEFCRRGIPQAVFFDTFRDLTIWSDQYAAAAGRPGLAEWGWNAQLLRMEVFRLGRLEFQPRRQPRAIAAGGLRWPAGTPSLEVHIPAGDPLTPEGLAASFAWAGRFFPAQGVAYALFHCHSWLLAGALPSLLPPESGILAFQRCFSIYDEDYDFPQAEERVFGAVLPDPADYPANTALQRRLRQWLCAGRRIGMGWGARPAN